MKKAIISLTVIIASLPAFAQNMRFTRDGIDGEAFRTISIIVLLVLIMNFCLNILKRIFEHRLKNKIVDKGIPQDVASSILQTGEAENKNAPVKWFALLAGIGAGLTIVNYTPPLGIHSLAIMSFCIAFSFLGYFLFTRKNDK